MNVKTPRKKVEKQQTRHPILVRVHPQTPKSPHVVDLTSREAENIAHALPVYAPIRFVPPQRKPIDMARVVTTANNLRSQAEAIRNVGMRPSVQMQKHRATFSTVIRGVSASLASLPWPRIGAAIAAILLVAALPFPAMRYYRGLKETGAAAAAESARAFFALRESTEAALAADLPKAEADVQSAIQSFETVDRLLSGDTRVLLSFARLLPGIGSEVATKEGLLDAGRRAAQGNRHLLRAFEEIQGSNAPLTERIALARESLSLASLEYRAARDDMAAADPAGLPEEYRDAFANVRLLFSAFVDDVDDLIRLSDAVYLLFGSEEFHRYLLVFQNNHELRATGGFIGSFAVLDVQKGRVVNLEVPKGGTYDLQGQLSAYVRPPLPLQLVNRRWELQDANWFPDFPSSAKKISWFYTQSRGATVDGVIAINATVLERVLSVMGPVSVSARNLTLAEDTALQKIQHVTESEEGRLTGAPKAVIGDTIAAVQDRLPSLSAPQSAALLATLHDALAKKEIQIYTTDARAQGAIASFGWTGEMEQGAPAQDALFVVASNVGGGKTDAVMEQEIEHEARITDDGSVIDTVMIRRRHALSNDPLYSGPNMSYVRVYVPLGAELLDAGGFNYPPENAFLAPEPWYADDPDVARAESAAVYKKSGMRISKESGRTVFGNWMVTDGGETSQAYVVYRLPFRLAVEKSSAGTPLRTLRASLANAGTPAIRYSMHIEKQSGIESGISSVVILPDGWRPVWRTDNRVVVAENGATISGQLASDMVYGIVAEQK